jgi:hypothetical protein
MKHNMKYKIVAPRNICKFESDSFDKRQNVLSYLGDFNKYPISILITAEVTRVRTSQPS